MYLAVRRIVDYVPVHSPGKGVINSPRAHWASVGAAARIASTDYIAAWGRFLCAVTLSLWGAEKAQGPSKHSHESGRSGFAAKMSSIRGSINGAYLCQYLWSVCRASGVSAPDWLFLSFVPSPHSQ